MVASLLDHHHIGPVWGPARASWTSEAHRGRGIQAVVEIAYSPSGDLPADLIRQAYMASQYGMVVFVLAGPTAREIDRVLDDVVQHLPLDIPGVRYVDSQDKASVLEFLVGAEQVFASACGALRPMATRRGCSVRTLSAAQSTFGRRTRRARHGGTLPRHL